MSEDRESLNMDESPKKEQLTFHYIKSNFFRVIHADGVWGGVTPRLDVHMALFSERSPIPAKITHAVTPLQKLGEEIQREVRDGIVREVEAEVIMDVGVARSLVKWLQERIDLIEKTQRETPSDTGEL
jgi:hypothetical protein